MTDSYVMANREIICPEDKRSPKSFNSNSDPISLDTAIDHYPSLSEDDNDRETDGSNSDDYEFENSTECLQLDEKLNDDDYDEKYTLQYDVNEINTIETVKTDDVGFGKNYECIKCGRTLSSASSLDRHGIVHSKERPFQCHFCESLFSTNGNMHRHERNKHMKRHNVRSGKKRKFSDFEASNSTDHTSHFNNDTNNDIDGNDRNNNNNDNNNNIGSEDDDVGNINNNSDNDADVAVDSNTKNKIANPHFTRNLSTGLSSKEKHSQCPLCDERVVNSSTTIEDHVKTHHSNCKPKCKLCHHEFHTYDLYDAHECKENPNFRRRKGKNGKLVDANEFNNILEMEQSYTCELCKQKFNESSFSVWCKPCKHLQESITSDTKLYVHSPLPKKKYRNADAAVSSQGTNFSPRLKEMLESSNNDEKKNMFLAGLNLHSKWNNAVTERSLSQLNDSCDKYQHLLRSHNAKSDLADIKSILSLTSSSKFSDSDVNALVNSKPAILNLLLPSSKCYVNEDDNIDPFKSEVRDMKRRGEFPCRICQKIFRNLRALKGHARIHISNNRGNNPYECNICPYTTLDKSAITRHVRSHNGDHPYKCQLCFSTFTTKANCERHLRNAHRKTSREDIKRLLLDLNGKQQNYPSNFKSTVHNLLTGIKVTNDIAVSNSKDEKIEPENVGDVIVNGMTKPMVLLYDEQDDDSDSKNMWGMTNHNAEIINHTIPSVFYGLNGHMILKGTRRKDRDARAYVLNKDKYFISDDNNNSNSSSMFNKEDSCDKNHFISESGILVDHFSKNSNHFIIRNMESGCRVIENCSNSNDDNSCKETDSISNQCDDEGDSSDKTLNENDGDDDNSDDVSISIGVNVTAEPYADNHTIYPSSLLDMRISKMRTGTSMVSESCFQPYYNGIIENPRFKKPLIQRDCAVRSLEENYFANDDEPLDLRVNVLDLSKKKYKTEDSEMTVNSTDAHYYMKVKDLSVKSNSQSAIYNNDNNNSRYSFNLNNNKLKIESVDDNVGFTSDSLLKPSKRMLMKDMTAGGSILNHRLNQKSASEYDDLKVVKFADNQIISNSFPTTYLLPGSDLNLFSNAVNSKTADSRTNNFQNGIFHNFQLTTPVFQPLILGQLVAGRIEDGATNIPPFEDLDRNTENMQMEDSKNEPKVMSPIPVVKEQKQNISGGLKESSGTTKIKNNKASTVKMVMKDGILVEKQKQRRYRTEKPFSCSYCSGRFTLRSNMDRHVKQQHPAFWKQRQRGSGRPHRNHNCKDSVTSINHCPEISDASNSLSPSLTAIQSCAGNYFSNDVKMETDNPCSEHEIQSNKSDQEEAKNVSNGKEGDKDTIKLEIIENYFENQIDDDDNELVIDEELSPDMEISHSGNDHEKSVNNGNTENIYAGSKEENPDLASVRTLLDNVSTQTFSQFFHSEEDRSSRHEDCSEEDEEGLVAGSGSEGNVSGSEENRNSSDTNRIHNTKGIKKKKSAYSTAPNRVHCDFCYRSFPWASSLRRHTLTHTGQKPYKCSSCPLLFTTKSNCDRHFLRKHRSQLALDHSISASIITSNTTLVVSTANSVEGSSLTMPTFVTRNVPERPFKCVHCPSSTFSTCTNLKKHLSEKHNNFKENGILSKNSTLLNNMEHGEEIQNGTNIRVKEEPFDEDQVMGEQPSPEQEDFKDSCIVKNSLNMLDVNTSGNHGSSDLPYKCHLCDRSFTERQEALDHIKELHSTEYNHLIYKGALDLNARLEEPSIHDEPPMTHSDEFGEHHRGRFPDYSSRKVICAFCLRRFWSAEDLRRHMRTHTGERPFACDICQRRFTLKHSMLRHRKKHSGKFSAFMSGENSPNTDDEDPSSPTLSYCQNFKYDDTTTMANENHGAGNAPQNYTKIAKESDLSIIPNHLTSPNDKIVRKISPGRFFDEKAHVTGEVYGKQDLHKTLKIVPFSTQKEDGVDLIAKLLDIEDKSLVDDMLTNKSADDVAKLLGVKK